MKEYLINEEDGYLLTNIDHLVVEYYVISSIG